MADVNQVITLGIGTPSGISEFLTYGLQIAAIAAITTPGLEFTVPNGIMDYTIPISRTHYTVNEED